LLSSVIVQIDDAAVRIIQSNIRKANIINQWSWWKLLNKIKPLMVVRKTEEEKKEISVSGCSVLVANIHGVWVIYK